jgi:hypothetical protein
MSLVDIPTKEVVGQINQDMFRWKSERKIFAFLFSHWNRFALSSLLFNFALEYALNINGNCETVKHTIIVVVHRRPIQKYIKFPRSAFVFTKHRQRETGFLLTCFCLSFDFSFYWKLDFNKTKNQKKGWNILTTDHLRWWCFGENESARRELFFLIRREWATRKVIMFYNDNNNNIIINNNNNNNNNNDSNNNFMIDQDPQKK